MKVALARPVPVPARTQDWIRPQFSWQSRTSRGAGTSFPRGLERHLLVGFGKDKSAMAGREVLPRRGPG